MSSVLDNLSASAVSVTVAGNTGISPFLSLLIVGAIQYADPELLYMGDTAQKVLSSIPALITLGILTVVELIGNCIPVVDQVIDSISTFIVPIASAFGTFATMGLFDLSSEEASNNTSPNNDSTEQSLRKLGVTSGVAIFLQIILVVFGIIMALLIRAFKMLVRLIGVGFLTACLTILERIWIICSILMAIYIRPIAVVIAGMFCLFSLYSFKKNYLDKRSKKMAENHTIEFTDEEKFPGTAAAEGL